MKPTPLPTNVLIVGGDRSSFELIRSGLLDAQPFWNVTFASEVADARRQIDENDSLDAVVVQPTLNTVEGTALLELVRSSQPQLARIMVANRSFGLSGPIASVAHQVVEPPVEPEMLEKAIEGSVALQQRINDPALHKLLDEIDVLPSPAQPVIELNAAFAREGVEVSEIAKIVESDVAISAKLLRLVNSAFFGLENEITQVGQAIAYLGLPTVRNLVTSLALARSFDSQSPELAAAVEDHQHHSQAVAELSRTLISNRLRGQDAYVAGLLHDVGLLALMSCSPVRYFALREEALHSGRTLEECELDVIGATHPVIGAYVLDLWGMPSSLVEAVARSHDAESLSEWSLDVTSAVFVAEQLVNVLGIRPSWEGGQMPSPEYIYALGLDDTVRQLANEHGFTELPSGLDREPED